MTTEALPVQILHDGGGVPIKCVRGWFRELTTISILWEQLTLW